MRYLSEKWPWCPTTRHCSITNILRWQRLSVSQPNLPSSSCKQRGEWRLLGRWSMPWLHETYGGGRMEMHRLKAFLQLRVEMLPATPNTYMMGETWSLILLTTLAFPNKSNMLKTTKFSYGYGEWYEVGCQDGAACHQNQVFLVLGHDHHVRCRCHCC